MRRYAIVGVVVSLCLLAVVFAQGNHGTIRGVVTDPTGKGIAGAVVELSQPAAMKTAQRATTNARGEFSFTGLEPGTYTITATLAGYQTTTTTTAVQSGRIVNLSLPLTSGRFDEVHAVTGDPKVERQAVQAMKDAAANAAEIAAGGAMRARMSAPPPNPSAQPVAAPPPPPPGYYQSLMAKRPEFNTEAYDRIVDNGWIAVSRKPLSTFSTDVDTASYSNTRRFLNGGQAPPKDAVRIEELINYFTFDYAEPRDGKPVSITTAMSECPWNPSHRLALVGLQARRIDASKIPPRNLVFLIDVSGSMQPANKLPLVKASLAMLAPNLTERDRVAIVVYAGNSGLVLPSTAGSDTTTILEALQRLEAGGSTNGAAGVQLAYQVAQEHFIRGGVNRVILATDGDFNVGVTDQGSLLRLIEEKRKSGIALSVLGYGMGNVKDSTMEKLADAGNGNYAYIDSLDEAQKVLVEQAGGTLVTVAKDVKLQIEFNPRVVGAYRLIGYENRLLQDQDFNDDKKDAGDMGAGHTVTALYELVPAGQPVPAASIDPLKYQQPSMLAALATDEVMTVKMRYKEPDGDVSSLVSAVVSARATASPALGFAAAVAEFGMLLRDSEFKGSSSFRSARELAERFKGDDPYGHRAEFIRLIGAAEGVSRIQVTGSR